MTFRLLYFPPPLLGEFGLENVMIGVPTELVVHAVTAELRISVSRYPDACLDPSSGVDRRCGSQRWQPPVLASFFPARIGKLAAARGAFLWAWLLAGSGALFAADAVVPANTAAAVQDELVGDVTSSSEARRQRALRDWKWGTPTDLTRVEALSQLLQDSRARRTQTPSVYQALVRLTESPLDQADVVLATALSHPDWRVDLLAADALARRQSGGRFVHQLRDCWSSPAAEQQYGLRHALVCALAEARDVAGLDATIDLLPELRGQLKFEALSRLTQRTGQSYGDRLEEWQQWKLRQPTVWNRPAIPVQDLPVNLKWQTVLPKFFEVPIYAQRLLFVVDVSNSMHSTVGRQSRMELVCEQLSEAIKRLPEDTWFDVIFYNDQLKPWQSRLVPATVANRTAAIQAAFAITPARRTAINDALELALEYPAADVSGPAYLEQILVLSDGKPTAGRIQAIDAIVKNITARNQATRTRIDTLGFDTANESEAFLSNLARENYGKYYKLR